MASDVAPVIIVVSDDRPTSDQLVTLIETRGFGAVVCTTAAKFIDRWTLLHGACVILDLDLPEGGGESLALLFRELAGRTPLLLVGGRTNDDLRSKVESVDAIALLEKPVVPLVLFAAIHEALRMGEEDVFEQNG